LFCVYHLRLLVAVAAAVAAAEMVEHLHLNPQQYLLHPQMLIACLLMTALL
jgi:hypothetical protein